MQLFDDKENQYMLNAIDAYVRANGIQVAQLGLTIVQKLQAMAQTPLEPSEDPDD